MALDMASQRKKSDELSQALELTDGAIARVRNISYLLHPPLLDESGLLPALHWFVDGFNKRSKLKVTLESTPSSFPRLSNDLETTIFRIIQEYVTNVYRHSGSADARVEIHQQPERVIVKVRDFGKGIDATVTGEALPVTTGVGIGGMRERLKRFGGDLRVSRTEPGTLVEAIVPLFDSGLVALS